MNTHPGVLTIMAHPDDAESLCGGTLALLANRGWRVRVGVLSGGEYGSVGGTCEQTRAARLREASAGAAVLGGDAVWAGLHDLELVYTPANLKAAADLLRGFSPDIVITHAPECYHGDHQEAAKLGWMACFAAGVPLLATGQPTMARSIPHLYYADAIGGVDRFGRPVIGTLHIDVASVFDRRQQALACHESQRAWMRAHHGVDGFLAQNEQRAASIGARCGLRHAEGFRQHLAPPFPADDRLAAELASFARQG
jgi:LmbE family N-acetylglucosaminyl deacetylase